MKKLSISSNLEEKIYDIKWEADRIPSKITTYFPLNHKEKQEILKTTKMFLENSVVFKSIFSDEISNEDWKKSKEQIKKRFRDELIDIQ